MGMRACRIVLSTLSIVSMAASVGLLISAVATPWWQTADFSGNPTVGRLYHQGLWENCVTYVPPIQNSQRPQSQQPMIVGPQEDPNLILFENPNVPGQSLFPQLQRQNFQRCSWIPYAGNVYTEQQQQQQQRLTASQLQLQLWQTNTRPFFLNNNLLEDPRSPWRFQGNYYEQYTGESWRLAALILLAISCAIGIFALLFGIVEICLDACRVKMCLRVISVMSFILLVVSFICSAVGLALYAGNTGAVQNLFVLELNGIAKFYYGLSFYLAIIGAACGAGAIFFSFADMLLVCVVTKGQHLGRKRSFNEMYDRMPAVPRADNYGFITANDSKNNNNNNNRWKGGKY